MIWLRSITWPKQSKTQQNYVHISCNELYESKSSQRVFNDFVSLQRCIPDSCHGGCSVINSLCPSDAMWCHKTQSSLVHVICLVAWWHEAITWTNVHIFLVRFCGIHLRGSFTESVPDINPWNRFKYYPFQLTTTSTRGQWVNFYV